MEDQKVTAMGKWNPEIYQQVADRVFDRIGAHRTYLPISRECLPDMAILAEGITAGRDNGFDVYAAMGDMFKVITAKARKKIYRKKNFMREPDFSEKEIKKLRFQDVLFTRNDFKTGIRFSDYEEEEAKDICTDLAIDTLCKAGILAQSTFGANNYFLAESNFTKDCLLYLDESTEFTVGIPRSPFWYMITKAHAAEFEFYSVENQAYETLLDAKEIRP